MFFLREKEDRAGARSDGFTRGGWSDHELVGLRQEPDTSGVREVEFVAGGAFEPDAFVAQVDDPRARHIGGETLQEPARGFSLGGWDVFDHATEEGVLH